MTEMGRTPLKPDDLFRRAEVNAEGLISWLRLGVSSVLLISFIFALGTADAPVAEAIADSEVRRLQLYYALGTMASYFVLGTLCLVLIYFGQFRNWMVWPSAAGDCLFILSGIWFGLQNTGLTSDYMSILPTLWLIPVVLASGVLRFNPRVQLFTLGLLILGVLCVGLVFPTIIPAPQDALDVFFAEPPNVMRLVMMALAGAVMILATWRMRSLFLRALRETEQRVNLTRYVPAEVAQDLAQAGMEALEGGSRQDVAVMFVDMRDFTTRSESMPPDELSDFVKAYRRHVTQAAREHDGIVDKFIGDAVMLVFGEARGALHPAARAIACGLSALKEIEKWSQNLSTEVKIGVGIHYGEVFAGVIGDGDRLEYSVFGDTVNVAARLEALTKNAGTELIASRDTIEAAGEDLGDWVALPDTTLRGKSAPLAIFGRNLTH